MNLAQVLRTAPDAPSAFQSAGQRSAELYADILAVAPGGDGRVDIEAVQSRLPSCAAPRPCCPKRPAGDRPAGVRRPDGIAVTTALALHTGLPFATVTGGTGGGDEARLTGEAHAGEHTVVVVPLVGTAQDAAPPVLAARKAGMRVSGVLSVLDSSDGSGGSSVADVLQERYDVRFHALFSAFPALPALPAFSTTTDKKEVDPR